MPLLQGGEGGVSNGRIGEGKSSQVRARVLQLGQQVAVQAWVGDDSAATQEVKAWFYGSEGVLLPSARNIQLPLCRLRFLPVPRLQQLYTGETAPG